MHHFNETGTQWTDRGPWAFYLTNSPCKLCVALSYFIWSLFVLLLLQKELVEHILDNPDYTPGPVMVGFLTKVEWRIRDHLIGRPEMPSM